MYLKKLMKKAFDIAFNQIQQEQEQIELKLTGKIPKWVSGSFYRNGPGLLKCSTQTYNHWFDGLAMVHKFDIADGKVSYQSKYLESNVRDSILESGSITFPEFATDPCSSIFKKLLSSFKHTNPKVSLQECDNQLLALGETRVQLEIDKNTLATLGIHDYSDTPLAPAVTTAHPHVVDNHLYNLVVSMGPLNFYKIVRYNIGTKKTETLCKIPISKPAYIHSIGMSDNYFIIAHYPYNSNTIDFVLKNKPFIENFKWIKNKQVTFFIVSRKSNKVVHKVKTDPFFAFHFINAYEEDDSLIFDMVTYPDSGIIDSFYLEKLSDMNERLQESNLHRFKYNLRSNALQRSQVTAHSLELPTMDNRFLQKNYNHTYAVGVSDEGHQQFYDQLIKTNMHTGLSLIWKDPDYYPGEPIFIPDNHYNEDDEGVILSILINIADESKGSKLLVLDAKTFTEIASVQINHSIMPGFHGCYIN